MATVTNSIPHPMLCVPRQNAHALRTLGKRPTSTDRCLSIRRTNTRHALSCLSIRIGIQQIVVSSQSWFLASLACRLTIHSSRPPSASAEFVALGADISDRRNNAFMAFVCSGHWRLMPKLGLDFKSRALAGDVHLDPAMPSTIHHRQFWLAVAAHFLEYIIEGLRRRLRCLY